MSRNNAYIAEDVPMIHMMRRFTSTDNLPLFANIHELFHSHLQNQYSYIKHEFRKWNYPPMTKNGVHIAGDLPNINTP